MPMAALVPLPDPPRTPSPLSDDEAGAAPALGAGHVLDPHLLSLNSIPRSASSSGLAIPFASEQRNASSTSLPLPQANPGKGASSMSDEAEDVHSEPEHNPFRFKTTSLAPHKTPVKPNVGQRRGHKYKHSSMSHQIFLEPAPRAPLRLPASLPIPTRHEGWRSMSREQTVRLCWCFCHLFVAGYVQWTAQGSQALTALSHLLFYDAIGAFLCAGVEVLSNFEVWERSSVRQPFGLERTEVLIGFAMSILLLFMGFDLVSHGAGHFLAELGEHETHRPHNHTRVSQTGINLTSTLAILSTVVSALLLKNHARMARAMRFARIAFLPSVLNNPSHLLTIGCSTILLLLPFASSETYTWFDRALSAAIAVLMCLLGAQLVRTLGSMLLMSYGERHAGEIAAVLRDVESDPCVRSVEEAKFWQVHYGLCMANLRIRVTRGAGEEAALKLRERVTSLVRNRLGATHGNSAIDSGARWEVSTSLVGF